MTSKILNFYRIALCAMVLLAAVPAHSMDPQTETFLRSGHVPQAAWDRILKRGMERGMALSIPRRGVAPILTEARTLLGTYLTKPLAAPVLNNGNIQPVKPTPRDSFRELEADVRNVCLELERTDLAALDDDALLGLLTRVRYATVMSVGEITKHNWQYGRGEYHQGQMVNRLAEPLYGVATKLGNLTQAGTTMKAMIVSLVRNLKEMDEDLERTGDFEAFTAKYDYILHQYKKEDYPPVSMYVLANAQRNDVIFETVKVKAKVADALRTGGARDLIDSLTALKKSPRYPVIGAFQPVSALEKSAMVALNVLILKAGASQIQEFTIPVFKEGTEALFREKKKGLEVLAEAIGNAVADVSPLLPLVTLDLTFLPLTGGQQAALTVFREKSGRLLTTQQQVMKGITDAALQANRLAMARQNEERRYSERIDHVVGSVMALAQYLRAYVNTTVPIYKIEHDNLMKSLVEDLAANIRKDDTAFWASVKSGVNNYVIRLPARDGALLVMEMEAVKRSYLDSPARPN